jgi:hypothetical protein
MLGIGELVFLIGISGLFLLVLIAVFFFLLHRDGPGQE